MLPLLLNSLIIIVCQMLFVMVQSCQLQVQNSPVDRLHLAAPSARRQRAPGPDLNPRRRRAADHGRMLCSAVCEDCRAGRRLLGRAPALESGPSMGMSLWPSRRTCSFVMCVCGLRKSARWRSWDQCANGPRVVR
jgi:hypothetical protein